jgi:hypothetical protein
LAAFIVDVQVDAVPLHPPLQPVNVEPASGVAVSVTVEPATKLARQADPQEMPDGEDVTVPLPVPPLVTDSGHVPAEVVVNVAVTDLAALIVTVQVGALPLHSPPQPAKVIPLPAAAVKVTLDSAAKLAEQVLPQAIPAGADVTVPVPVPFLATVNA